jgi:hypothetical protein
MASPGWRCGGFLLQALMRAVLIGVASVLGQDIAEMPRAEDQHVVKALAAQRAHESLRECVRPRRPDWRLDHPRAVPGEDVIECRGELAVPVTDQEPESAGALAEVHEKAAGLLHGPGSVG